MDTNTNYCATHILTPNVKSRRRRR